MSRAPESTDGQVGNQPFYAAIGVDLGGRRDVLGLWAGKGGGESAMFWMSVLADLKNRGVGDVFFVVCDGLKGLPDSVNAVSSRAIVQACVIHLIRVTLRYASRQYWDRLAKDLRGIYTAPSVDAAWSAFEELEEKWGQPYPAIPRLWRAAWEEFTPFLAYGGCCGIGGSGGGGRRLRREYSVVAKSFRPVLRDQPMLLPVDMRDWLPPDHLVWFVLDVVDALDTAELERGRRRGGAGTAGYDPRMLFALLVYAYCQGVRSSRQIERLCSTDVAFRVLCAQDSPDHTTIARFRAEAAEAAEAFTDLFAQVLLVAATAGLARFGTVAIDGTKIAANASIDATRGRVWFERHAAELIGHAEATDWVEDAAAAQDGEQRPDRVPAGLVDRTSRGERIRAAATELAAHDQRRGQAEQERQQGALARRRRSEQGQPVVGRIPDGPHRLAEARAHLAREVAEHQVKLNRYAAITARGGKPMGRPPVPMDDSSRVARARRVVAAAEDAAARTAEQRAASRPDLPKTVANTTDPQSRIMPGPRPPWHDVQLAIQGPAVGDVEAVFRERWQDPAALSRSPFRQISTRRDHPVTTTPLPTQLPDPSAAGEHPVQVLRTYPQRFGGYPFAPRGERSVARAYTKVLARAEHLVYLEDQYLWSSEVAAVFANALRRQPRLHLVAVLPLHPDQDGRVSMPPNLVSRQRLIDDLNAAGPGRVGIYGIEHRRGTPIYVHAKVCIVDDTWASVGSDNFNRRSWTHDSEVSAAVAHPGYARALRDTLVGEHLGTEAKGSLEMDLLPDVFRRTAAELEAWHHNGQHGRRPQGQVRPLPRADLSWRTRWWSVPAYRMVYDPDGRPLTQRLHRTARQPAARSAPTPSFTVASGWASSFVRSSRVTCVSVSPVIVTMSRMPTLSRPSRCSAAARVRS